MNEYCTCGAKLPEDARFCHKCGKPQREEPEIEALAQETVVTASLAPPAVDLPVPPTVTTIGFRNPMAVRASLVASALATLAGLLPLPGPFHSLWQLLTITAAGFASVYFYQRRTGAYLSVRGGLQIGWMTGLFCFVVTIVMLTLLLALIAGLGESGLKKLTAESGRPEIADAFMSMMSNPAMLIFALAGAFFLMTVLASAGGALGSKVLEKE
ncbi:MAG TPA: zinc ribbon domain-containing protein [Bryobacteraceae bacterium]|nr:zinc ribbon domain-containing protein [Bryobacteraceae bacterium]